MVELILGVATAVSVGLVIFLALRSSEHRKDLEKARARLATAEKDLQRTERRAEDLGKKHEKVTSGQDNLAGRFKDLEKRLKVLQDQNKKLETETRAGERDAMDLRDDLAAMTNERDALKKRAKAAEADLGKRDARIAELDRELDAAQNAAAKAEERAKNAAAAAAARPAVPAPPPRPAPEKREPVEDPRVPELERAVKDLRKRLRETDLQARIQHRMAEQNQRAYRITQLQLDLEQDKVYYLVHGTHRRPHRESLVPSIEAAVADEKAIAAEEREKDARAEAQRRERRERRPRRSDAPEAAPAVDEEAFDDLDVGAEDESGEDERQVEAPVETPAETPVETPVEPSDTLAQERAETMSVPEALAAAAAETGPDAPGADETPAAEETPAVDEKPGAEEKPAE